MSFFFAFSASKIGCYFVYCVRNAYYAYACVLATKKTVFKNNKREKEKVWLRVTERVAQGGTDRENERERERARARNMTKIHALDIRLISQIFFVRVFWIYK